MGARACFGSKRSRYFPLHNPFFLVFDAQVNVSSFLLFFVALFTILYYSGPYTNNVYA